MVSPISNEATGPTEELAMEKETVTTSVLDASSTQDGNSRHNVGAIVTETLGSNATFKVQRRLNNRQIQLNAIGGTIGGALFIAMGGALSHGGPGSLLLGYFIHIWFQAITAACSAEMDTFMPVPAAFIQHASKWVDPALGFMVGWNYYIYVALGIPFEMVSTSLILGFWRDDIPIAAVICVMIVLYTLLNAVAVNYYGEAEFWLSTGKVLLLAICFCFTFVTMVGGNPQHDAYGFRTWNNPVRYNIHVSTKPARDGILITRSIRQGAFLEYIHTGSLGRFEGFLACYFQASYIITGPDYVSVMAGEALNPRVTVKNAYKTMFWRFLIFFVGSALCIGIVLPANDPTLLGVLNGTKPGAGTGAASPYVIAARNMGITALPSIINALLLTSIISAGNNYLYGGTRALYGLAKQGQAPKIFPRCTKSGIPIYCLAATLLFSAVAFLQLSNSSSKVYYWLVSLGTAGGLINYLTIIITYIFFYRGLKAQGIDRSTLPSRGWAQPYLSYVNAVWFPIVLLTFGYSSFVFPWSNDTFFSYYILLLLAPVTFCFWKIVKRTKFVKPSEMDLVWERPAVDAHEATLVGEDIGFWREMLQLVGIGRDKGVRVVEKA
ncbi:General amino acid permease AGP2 [Fonsecaea nubica]|uniref:General amino acid permease AGP2 n=1 Tax=Fonsecaea nubica TaxID=856822 RepID=A0A178BMA5_9EURO|nr:General amino acid permease AGP2 [Fonsecaea nubica]OAL18770.1 General amino acid permease AGP2 [Fonsecaea nubica]